MSLRVDDGPYPDRNQSTASIRQRPPQGRHRTWVLRCLKGLSEVVVRDNLTNTLSGQHVHCQRWGMGILVKEEASPDCNPPSVDL